MNSKVHESIEVSNFSFQLNNRLIVEDSENKRS